MEPKIQLKHPAGKKAVSMDRKKYELIKNSILTILTTKGKVTHTELLKAIAEDFKKHSTAFEGSLPWHMEWVKLDLEARKQVKRITDTTPPKFSNK